MEARLRATPVSLVHGSHEGNFRQGWVQNPVEILEICLWTDCVSGRECSFPVMCFSCGVVLVAVIGSGKQVMPRTALSWRPKINIGRQLGESPRVHLCIRELQIGKGKKPNSLVCSGTSSFPGRSLGILSREGHCGWAWK